MNASIAEVLTQLLDAPPLIDMDQRQIHTQVDLGTRPGTDSTVRLRLIANFSNRTYTGALSWEVVTANGAISYSWKYPKEYVLAQSFVHRFSQKRLAYLFHDAHVALRQMIAQAQPSEAGQPLMVPESVADLFDLGYDELRKREESTAAKVG